MWQGRWIESYQQMENIEYALARMATRSVRIAPLADCFSELERSYHQLLPLFEQLYPDVLEKSKQTAQGMAD